MIYTEDEVFRFVSENDVKFIRLAFVDVFGNQKNISIMPNQLQKAIHEGIKIDSSMIKGFEVSNGSDLLLLPDLDTLSLLPWRPQRGRVIRFYCFIQNLDHSPFELDSREILKKALKEALKKDIDFTFGSRMEFYLFKKDENDTKVYFPLDEAGYLDIAPMDKGENVRREICLTLEEMHIIPTASHHEEGPGQNEIEFQESDPMNAADNLTTVKNVCKTVADHNGLWASFDPYPLDGCPGNGFHIKIGANEALENIAAGILNYAKDILFLSNSSEDSYKRLGNGRAPKSINWSVENNGSALRVAEDWSFIEFRLPDGHANPYLLFASLIYAGIEGIKQGLNLHDYKEVKLPLTKGEALSIASEGKWVEKILPKAIIKAYEN